MSTGPYLGYLRWKTNSKKKFGGSCSRTTLSLDPMTLSLREGMGGQMFPKSKGGGGFGEDLVYWGWVQMTRKVCISQNECKKVQFFKSAKNVTRKIIQAMCSNPGTTSHCKLKAKKWDLIFLLEALSNSCWLRDENIRWIFWKHYVQQRWKWTCTHVIEKRYIYI